MVFYQTFYLGIYTENHEVELSNSISLRQGFDENVTFEIDGGKDNFYNNMKV